MPVFALAACAGLLLLILGLTARPPEQPLPDVTTYLSEWQALHGGYNPSRSAAASRWLRGTYRVARLPSRLGWQPDVVSFVGPLLAGALVLIARAGGAWPLLGVLVAVLSGLADSLDGAVAVLTRNTSPFGAVLDSVLDRGSDSLYFLAFWQLGAPAPLCLSLAGITFLQEYARARASVSGLREIAVVTVWERPSRVIVVAATMLGSGLVVHHQHTVSTVGASVGLGLAGLGLVTLLVVVRRRLMAR